MPAGEILNRLLFRAFTDPVRYINRVKIRMRDEASYRFEPDVISVHEVICRPGQCPNSGVGRGARGCGVGPDRLMLAIGLVPNRNDVHAMLCRQHTGPQLGTRLAREAVANTNRILLKLKTFRHIPGGPAKALV